MLDPRGHVAGRDLAARSGVAVVWAAQGIRESIAREVTSAGLTPLVATAFHHVITSLHPTAPHAQIAVIDFDIIGAAEISLLVSLRWNGSRARLIALARSGTVDPRNAQLASVDRVVKPAALAGVLAPRSTRF